MNMNLDDAIKKVLLLRDDDLVIFAKRPWNLKSNCVIDKLDSDYRIPLSISNDGFEYFLEYSIVEELNEIKKEMLIDESKFISLVIFYAENDAYPEWVNK